MSMKIFQKRESGMTMLLFILMWSPIFLLMFNILFLRAKAVFIVHQQKKLDHCVYTVLKNRCETLNRLSESNFVLRKTIHALYVAKFGQALGLVTGGTITAVAKTSEEALLKLAKSIVVYQDGLIQLQKSLSKTQSLVCSLGLVKNNEPPTFQRPESMEAELVGVSPPLLWENQKDYAVFHIWKYQKQTSFNSFGHCEIEKTKTVKNLNGEKYSISMEKAPEV